MSRKYLTFKIEELEALYDKQPHDLRILSELAQELAHRNTPRAKTLATKVNNSLKPTAQEIQINKVTIPKAVSKPKPIDPLPHPDNQPQNILSAWTALEVLSPQTFKKPQDLVSGDLKLVAKLEKGLPWENGGEHAPSGAKLYYQVVLGVINVEKATKALLELYADARIEQPTAKSEAILAVIMVDREGKPAGESPIAISSFGWGVPKALVGDLKGLSGWREAEEVLLKNMDKLIRQTNEAGEVQALDQAVLTSAYAFLVNQLNLNADLVRPYEFALRYYERTKNAEPPEPLLLNSFYLKDLALSCELFKANKPTGNLKKYLGLDVPKNRKDLNHDLKELEKLVSPERIPKGRWPSAGKSSLVLLQQAAVNIALSELKSDGILAVNGPPGTGKTTLLRDIVAGIICDRAEAMATFDNPSEAFRQTGQKLAAGSAQLTLSALDAKIKGHEIIITSSNNKAVENVSAELPGIHAIGNLPDLRYFNLLSDQLLERDTWGLIAAVLGNAANRGKFKKTFWWDKDLGMNTYLLEAAGFPQFIDVSDPNTHQVIGQRKPKIVEAEKPPTDHTMALAQWHSARKHFLEVLDNSRKELAKLTELKKLIEILSDLKSKVLDSELELNTLQQKALAITERTQQLAEAQKELALELEISQKRIGVHHLDKPSWWKRLFNIDSAPIWKIRNKELSLSLLEIEKSIRQREIDTLEQHSLAKKNESSIKTAEGLWKEASEKYKITKQKVASAREGLDGNLIDDLFFTSSHSKRQQLSPWHNQHLRNTRDQVFVAAMALHKAFINAAAKPLRHNLAAMLMVLNGTPLTEKTKQALLPDLWSTLFLIVPAVSSTFASIERMLGNLPPESLGWLLVDEAGQALPQAAVGALMRTRRAVVVGDPLQIEPIVSLPPSLTRSICRHFAVNADRFNAPEASVQTLADAMSHYFTELESTAGSRSVGVPLLVHRRCAEPMFSISNQIAYGGLMVHAKAPGKSAIRDCLGGSRWVDIQGHGEEKWCPEEGQAVLELLQKLRAASVMPDIYMVTPFVSVAENLRRLLRESGLMTGWVAEPYFWINERIGTVHTVQGREAEAVIFVLGAPLAEQNGARNWAGGQVNLLNVAVTRAKEVLYVVGNRGLWKLAGVFSTLAQKLDT
ncbi:DEAD/DEAH box helicase [Mucilaginibacter sp. 22184]|uniref:DEAD/DEAH box helicase n=1 Tax=Mucilaginibacter sp. 22184 TaxID=3453887 RepID=UPI003F8795A3